MGGTPSDQATYSLTFDPNEPNRVYAPNFFGRGLLASTDGGVTWELRTGGLPTVPGASGIRSMAIDHVDPSVLVVGTPSGLFRSSDYGATFQMVDPGILVGETDIARVVSSSDGDLRGESRGSRAAQYRRGGWVGR